MTLKERLEKSKAIIADRLEGMSLEDLCLHFEEVEMDFLLDLSDPELEEIYSFQFNGEHVASCAEDAFTAATQLVE